MGRGSGINEPLLGTLQFPRIHLMLTATLEASSSSSLLYREQMTERSVTLLAHPAVNGKLDPGPEVVSATTLKSGRSGTGIAPFWPPAQEVSKL